MMAMISPLPALASSAASDAEETADQSEETTESYALIYDGTGLLDEDSVELETEELDEISAQYEIEFRLDIVTDIGDNTLQEVANYFYDEYNYGWGEDRDGVLLMIELEADETDVSFVDYYLIYNGEKEGLYDFSYALLETLSDQLTEEAWDGDMDDDNENFRLLIHRYVETAHSYFGDETDTTYIPLSQNADFSGLKENYIVDLGDLVTDSEEAALSERAKEIADTYHCGIYIVTVPDYADYGITINDCAKNIYRDCDLGYGEGKDGFILCMSTADRDYSFLAYGDFGNYALSEYAFNEISVAFKGEFRDDEWYDGFVDYQDTSQTAFRKAADGDPWSSANDEFTIVFFTVVMYIGTLILGLIIAAVVILRMNKIMQPVEDASHAYSFVDRKKIKINIRSDRHVNTTKRRTYNPPSRSSSGGSDYGSSGSSGGGFSGGSGKY